MEDTVNRPEASILKDMLTDLVANGGKIGYRVVVAVPEKGRQVYILKEVHDTYFVAEPEGNSATYYFPYCYVDYVYFGKA